MAAIKQTVSNAMATTQAQTEKAKNAVAEKVESATAHSHHQKTAAHQEKQMKDAAAECKLQAKKAANAAENTHMGTGYHVPGTGQHIGPGTHVPGTGAYVAGHHVPGTGAHIGTGQHVPGTGTYIGS